VIARQITKNWCARTEGIEPQSRKLERANKNSKILKQKIVSGWSIRSFHAFNHSLYVPWLFPFHHPELSSARRAGRNKVQFLMRRQHQMVAFAAPGYMIAKSTPVGNLTVFPLDRYIFVKSGHSLPPLGNAFYASLRLNPKKTSAMIEIPGRNIRCACPQEPR
jgi:hypothetical protein